VINGTGLQKQRNLKITCKYLAPLTIVGPQPYTG